jgi:hypothetical protein
LTRWAKSAALNMQGLRVFTGAPGEKTLTLDNCHVIDLRHFGTPSNV